MTTCRRHGEPVAERQNQEFELQAVTETLFVLDDNVQVQFEKESDGKISKLSMLWKDGTISSKPKL